MKRLAQIGITFMKSNKMLTLSAFLSIFVACFLSISMFQVSSNVEQSIERGMEAQKGAFDLQITKNEGKSFSNEEIKSLQQERNVKKTSGGYQTNDFLDIYMVGVVDDAINKSLYKYTKDVKGNSVIINDSLSLEHVNLTFHYGEKIALVGPNGAGKTTLILLLCRLYEPTHGRILLNGIDIREYDYEEYLAMFGVVFQDFKLFAMTVAENVAASEEYDEREIEEVLEKAGIWERVQKMEQGIHNPLYNVGIKGVEVSGGEAQKIAIARALYKKAPFIILDEPTSALDPMAEYEIYSSFDRLIQDRMAVYISHRMSSCRFCQRIIVLKDGQVQEQGTHEELIEKDGIYAMMWNAQAQNYQ